MSAKAIAIGVSVLFGDGDAVPRPGEARPSGQAIVRRNAKQDCSNGFIVG